MSAAVWRKMSADVEAMELTSGIPAAKVESGSLVTSPALQSPSSTDQTSGVSCRRIPRGALLPVSGGGWVRFVLGGGWKLKPGGGLISSSGGQ